MRDIERNTRTRVHMYIKKYARHILRLAYMYTQGNVRQEANLFVVACLVSALTAMEPLSDTLNELNFRSSSARRVFAEHARTFYSERLCTSCSVIYERIRNGVAVKV